MRLQHGAVALNFADTYFRTGLYPAPLPSGIGSDACGTVTAVGEGVTAFQVGDRVTYTGAHNTLGAYSTERLIDASTLIRLPKEIEFETAAGRLVRIAVASGAAFLTAQLLDVTVFNWLRRQSWWRCRWRPTASPQIRGTSAPAGRSSTAVG